MSLDNVKHVIAVASGKGGVGKSTTAVNLALAMSALGHKVGLLDADIYGPSLTMLLGIAEGTRPEVQNEQAFLPVEVHGIKVMSMGLLVTDKTPMVWRGPMASGALQQMLTQTAWDVDGGLDYLFVDMPPGTGDIQLTLSQKVALAGAVIVTTPQDIALLDAQKGVEMFRKVNVPVLGVVENMSLHICSECGHKEHIFGADGGARIAKDYDTELLGALPLALSIREYTDKGTPIVVVEPESEISLIYKSIAEKVADNVAKQGSQSAPSISIED